MPVNILNLPGLRVLDFKETEREYHTKTEPAAYPGICLHCGRSHTTIWHGKLPLFIRDLPIHGKSGMIHLDAQRLMCKICRGTFTATAPEIDEKIRRRDASHLHVRSGCVRRRRLLAQLRHHAVGGQDQPRDRSGILQRRARHLARIEHSHRDGLARREIGVLYRSNAQSRILEHALFSAGIPYRVYGGLCFFERMEVKHALAYLRLIASSEDDSAARG